MKIYTEFDKDKHVVTLDPTLLANADLKGGVIISTDIGHYRLEKVDFEVDKYDESVDKAVEIMQEQLLAHQQYAELLEWLYANDKGYDSVQAWREAFLEKLREVLIGESE